MRLKIPFQKNIKNSFSLIELSIALTIIAIIAGASLSVYNAKSDIYKIQQTKNKLDLIEKALSSFVRLNYRLPCPADISLAPLSSVHYGAEKCGCLATITGLSPTGFSCSSSQISGGMIPFKTLGLPKEFGIDGWGNKIIYNVTQGFTASDPTCAYGTPTTPVVDVFSSCNMGMIRINGPGTSNLRTNKAIYVLVSYGPNGYNAYSEYSSSSSPEPPSAVPIPASDEVGNAAVLSLGRVAQEPKIRFDDIVRYKTKWQVVKEAGGVFANASCQYAKTILESDDVLYSSNNKFYNKICGPKPTSPDCDSIINNFSNLIIQNMCLRK